MYSCRPLAFGTALLALVVSAPSGHAQSSEHLFVSTTEESYILSAPVSRLELTIPRSGGWVQKAVNIGGSTASPRYFYFEGGNGLIVSGWFEPSGRYRGIEEFWNQELSAWPRTRLPEPTDVSIEKLGNWDVVSYQVPVPMGASAHARAHWVQAGTWIDVHVSVTSNAPYSESRQVIEALLKSLGVREKPP